MTPNDLDRQFTAVGQIVPILTAVIRVMRVVTKRLRLESRGFRYKVALYLSYLQIKLNYEIKEIPSNLKSNFRLSCVRGSTDVYVWLYLQPDFAVTETLTSA